MARVAAHGRAHPRAAPAVIQRPASPTTCRENIGGSGSQGYPHADVARTLRHQIRGDSIEPGGGEQQSESGEGRKKPREESWAFGEPGDSIVQGLDGHRKLRCASLSHCAIFSSFAA